jgi:hypothetical protein
MPALAIGGTALGFGPPTVASRMAHWFSLAENAARNVYIGIDSVTEWPDYGGVEGVGSLLRTAMNDIWGSRGYGWMGTHRNVAIPGTTEWTVGSNWTGYTKQDLNDDGLWPSVEGRTHAGSTTVSAANLLTLNTIPQTTTRFEIVWQDMSTAVGPFAYRIDGGAWVDNPATRTGSNTMKRELINSAAATSIDFRPSNAAGTVATACGIVGVSLLNANSTGVLFHNFGMSGKSASQMTRGSRGDPLSFFSVMDTPDLVILESGNDCTTTATTGEEGYVDIWARNMLEIVAAIPDTASIVLTTIPPLDHDAYPTRSHAMQQSWRDMTLRLGKTIGAPVSDVFTGQGGIYSAALASGFQTWGDGAHEAQPGHNDMLARLERILGMD